MINAKEILTRGVKEAIDQKHIEEVLSSGKKLRVKLGIDPTSPNIHIGRAVLLWKLRAFQEMGHTAVFIVGDFTALIGDTSDKESERPMLTEEEVKSNLETYFDQAYKILDKEKTEVHFNSEWLKKIGFIEIAKMANLFGLHEFESREVISRRMKAGKRVSFTELMYPLMQGYDSVAVKADVEIGGTDQRFNLLAGRTIQPLYGQAPQDILMTDILEGTDGRKMSSSWGNTINLTDAAPDMFGKIMSLNDDFIIKYFELATKVPLEEIKELKENLKTSNPKDIKLRLAEEIVALYHGTEEAKKSKEEFEKVFSERKFPEDAPVLKVSGAVTTVTAMFESGLVSSKTEAKRLIEQGAVSRNNEKVKEFDEQLKPGDELRIGSHRFLKIGEK